MKNFEDYRIYFPIVQRCVYFNHASTAPLNSYSLKKTERYLNVLRDEGDVSWKFFQQISGTTRCYVAELLRVKPDEIAFVQNTSNGINLIIESINCKPEDEVVLVGHFPALLYCYSFDKLSKGFVGWVSGPWDGFSGFSNLPELYSDARIFETGTKNYWGLSYLGGNLNRKR